MRLAVSFMKCTLSLSLATVCNECFFKFYFLHRILQDSHQVLDITTYSSHNKVDGESEDSSSFSSPDGVQEAAPDMMEVYIFNTETLLCVGACAVGTGMYMSIDFCSPQHKAG